MKTVLIFYLFFMLSWCVNLGHFIKCDFNAPYKAEVFYGVGIFEPTCLVTAWIDLGR